MKKLSLIVALAVVLTIGGVFAAWQYPASNDVTGDTAGVTISIATPDTGSPDALTVTGSVTASVDGNAAYLTVWTLDSDLNIAFNAQNGSVYKADPTKQLAVTVAVTVTNQQYDSTNIVKSYEATKTTNIVDGGDFDVTIADLGLEFNDFTLDTKQKYDDFKAELEDVVITITISAAAA